MPSPGRSVRSDILPISLPPLGINREQAAALIGIGVSLFDKAVEAGTMPAPRMIGGRLIYDVQELIEAFRRLPHTRETLDLDGDRPTGNAFDNAKKSH
jgi:predicted DNA-binding transcriptional regulator AlpA